VNLTIHKGGPLGITPREAFFGTKFDFTRDCRVGFGDYVEATVPNSSVTKNTLKSRTESCIALLPFGNQGTVKCLSLSSGSVVSRDQFKVLPTPEFVINHFDKLAERFGSKEKISELHFCLQDSLVTGDYQFPNEDTVENDEEFVGSAEFRVLDADNAGFAEDVILLEERADSATLNLQEPVEILDQYDNDESLEPIQPSDHSEIHQELENSHEILTDTVPEVSNEQAIHLSQPLETIPQRKRVPLHKFDEGNTMHNIIDKSHLHHVLRTSVKKALSDPQMAPKAEEAIEKELRSLIGKPLKEPLNQYKSPL
jgi:hypothetical protein